MELRPHPGLAPLRKAPVDAETCSPLPIDVPNLSDCHIGSMSEGLRWIWEKEGGVPGVYGWEASPVTSGSKFSSIAWCRSNCDSQDSPVVADQ